MLLSIPALLFALVVTPLCIARSLAPRITLTATVALTGVLAVVLNMAVPLAMHLLGAPIRPTCLAAVHWCLAVGAAVILRLRRHSLLPPAARTDRHLLMLCGSFCVAVVPLTCLAGIDTYKWLDLAMSVQVEESIPWLAHPLSLLGFTGRSYPSAQPLLFATVLILGRLGVEWSYYLVSAVLGTLGIAAACILGEAFHSNRRDALWTAFLYGFSPVFVRYNHWATGRGLFLSLFPLFLLAVSDLPKLRALIAILVLGPLLALSHKTGSIAAGSVLVSLVLVPLLPRKPGRALVPALAAISAAGAIVFSPRIGAPFPLGSLLGFARTAATRFGWLLPLTATGLLAAPGWLTAPSHRRFLPAMVLTFPFACASNMYGALIALVFVTLAASHGIAWLRETLGMRAGLLRVGTVALVLAGALAILVNRSLTATPRRIRAAARFLEHYDPRGPYMIISRWQQQIQGYVSGCPRFEVSRTGPVRIVLHPPPTLRGKPGRVLSAWVAYARHMFGVTGVSVEYYGRNPRFYHVIADATSRPSGDMIRIYAQDGVEVYKPAAQPRPAGASPNRQSDSQGEGEQP